MGSGIPISTTYPMETGASRASIRLGLRRTVPFGIPSTGLYHNFWHFFIGATGDKPWDFEVIIYIYIASLVADIVVGDVISCSETGHGLFI